MKQVTRAIVHGQHLAPARVRRVVALDEGRSTLASMASILLMQLEFLTCHCCLQWMNAMMEKSGG
ncbi:MAG: hypothetical protein AAF447_25430, partial [Myxococcota bacterium]